MRSVGVFWVVLCGLCALFAPSSPTRAEEPIVIEVRAHSELTLKKVERTPERHKGLRVLFRVLLSDTGDPQTEDPSFGKRALSAQLAQGTDTVALPPVETSEDGSATFVAQGVAPGVYVLRVRFPGDKLRDEAEASFPIDLARVPTTLNVSVPETAPAQKPLSVRLSLQAEAEPISAPVTLTVGTARPESVSLSQGSAVFVAKPGPTQKAGDLLPITVQFPGTPELAPSFARAKVLLTSQAAVALSAKSLHPRGEFRQDSALVAVGIVKDDQGPLPGEWVELWAERDLDAGDDTGEAPRKLFHTQTDAQGRFVFRQEALTLPTGPFRLIAKALPKHTYVWPGESPPVSLVVLPQEPVSVGYFLFPLAATFALLLGAWLGRRAWQVAKAALQAYRQRRQAAREHSTDKRQTPVPVSSAEVTSSQPGIRLTQQGLLSSFRKAADFGMDGSVCDAVFGQRLTAQIAIHKPGGDSTPFAAAPTEPDGSFSSGPFPQGRLSVTVSAPGYLPESFFATFPHKGEYRNIQVALLPLRVRLLDEWRRVAEKLLGPVATKTPAEVLEQVASLGQASLAEPLSQLTALCETAYYSPRLCTPEMLVQSAQLAERILAAPSAPGAPNPKPPRATHSPHPLIPK